MKTKIFIGMSAIVLAVVGLFYACKKDSNRNELSNKKEQLMQSTGTTYANPYNYVGILHNECLDYMLKHWEKDTTLTKDELWTRYGVPYFQSVWGVSNTPIIPLADLHADFIVTCNIVTNKLYLGLLNELVSTGLINPALDIQSLIYPTGTTIPTGVPARRNNYNILLDYFTFLTTYTVVTEDNYWFAYNRLREAEQEVLANYYALSENRQFDANDELQAEYKVVLSYMSISGSSAIYWAKAGASYAAWEYYELRRIAEVDATAYGQGFTKYTKMGFDLYTADLFSTQSSTSQSMGATPSILL